MRKWSILIVLLVIGLFAICNFANADEHLWGKWKGENKEGSIVYTFEPGGRGTVHAIYRSGNPSEQREVVFQFFYVIDRKVTASSSIDSFREYLVKVWFPSQDLTGTMKILFRKDGKSIEVSEQDGARKLVLTRIGDFSMSYNHYR
ncbi:hypothetical protein GW816_02455 [Candidatus Wolfebacteria bacterium]|uniref:Lipocalin-like domain-containing protein n=2 Tax=Candidatus Wolfeibacteriota TaxID=1752735 RepID=A0A2M7Q7X3_9BACT|nr:hypothetical protein [Candidatus Wolfebacteria bacterium]NCP58300.1 hypothetical protein [Candidatus Wolfebacteria bacterium]NCQ02882.1 hypothetical protein [Candidatus Wolfebacteria bacterium]PIY59180.1 MAG: hypothetical protein COY97_00255 [Candidatus Wolfebacteria bacterium CG_4_10_14_0_8_um_filter_39_64]